MLEEEGLDNVFARHKRHGAAARAAVKAWGLETVSIESHDRSQRPQDAYRWHRRSGAAEGRRRAAAARGRRHLPGAREGHHRRRRVGRPL